nr:sister chromatid cohesion protein PDS5-like isoform X1 [Tanacetum cinerariifolium]
MPALTALGDSLDSYTEIVTRVCEGTTAAMKRDDENDSGQQPVKRPATIDLSSGSELKPQKQAGKKAVVTKEDSDTIKYDERLVGKRSKFGGLKIKLVARRAGSGNGLRWARVQTGKFNIRIKRARFKRARENGPFLGQHQMNEKKRASELKPYLMQAVTALGDPLDTYTEIVTSVCGGTTAMKIILSCLTFI